MNKLFFVMTILALLVGAAIIAVGCGGDDDDDDSSADDTVVAGDDTTGDTCTTGLTEVYDTCGLTLADASGNAIAFADAVTLCQGGDTVAACAAACGLSSADCTAVGTCFTDSCSAA